MIPYGRQLISEQDIEAVSQALQSPLITQGPRVAAFEQAIADYCHAPYGVALSSATAALHVACLALGVGPGDLVWTVPNTFVASANCARYCGADVDFVDIDPATGNLCVSALANKLTQAQAAGRLPKVIIPVHFAGASCDMRAIAALTTPLGIHIIEDASHAIGGRYEDLPVGASTYSDFTVFSFHPVKIITAGEGGVLTTQCKRLAERAALLRSHGITREPAQMSVENPEPWYYEQQELGFNYRMTDIQAALGMSQLTQLDAFVAKRNQLAANYRNAFTRHGIGFLDVASNVYSSYHLFVVQVPAAQRLEAFNALRAQGIGVHVHYIPVHWQPDFQPLGFQRGQFPQAEHYYSQALTIPLYVELTAAEQQHIIHQLQLLTSN